MNAISPAHRAFLNSADSYNPRKVVRMMSVARVRVKVSQVVYTRDALDSSYLLNTLIPSICEKPRVSDFPCIGVPSDVSRFPTNADPTVIIDLPDDCKIDMLDGHHRIEALKAIAGAGGSLTYWEFIILHPAVLSLRPSAFVLLQYSQVTKAVNCWKRHSARLLNIAASIAHELYLYQRGDVIESVVDCLVYPDVVHSYNERGDRRLEGTLDELFARILSSPEIVSAILQSNILYHKLWDEAGDDSVLFLFFVERYRVSKTAAQLIMAASEMCGSLSEELNRPVSLCDMLPAQTRAPFLSRSDRDGLLRLQNITGSFKNLQFVDFWERVTTVAKAYGIPELFLSPYALHPRSTSTRPLNEYMTQIREVLKGAVFLALGHGPFPTLATRPRLNMFPVDPRTDVWGTLEEFIRGTSEDGWGEMLNAVIKFLDARKVRYLARAWKQMVLDAAKLVAGPEVTIDSKLSLSNEPVGRQAVSSRIPGLLFKYRSWYQLGVHLGLEPGQQLPCSQPAHTPIFFTSQDPGPSEFDDDEEQARSTLPFPNDIPGIPLATDIIAVHQAHQFEVHLQSLENVVGAYLSLPREFQEALGGVDLSSVFLSAIMDNGTSFEEGGHQVEDPEIFFPSDCTDEWFQNMLSEPRLDFGDIGAFGESSMAEFLA